jgi:hypothetical protein
MKPRQWCVHNLVCKLLFDLFYLIIYVSLRFKKKTHIFSLMREYSVLTCLNISVYFDYRLYSEFFLRLAIGFYMLIFQPPVNFCSDENIQTIFGIKLKDFLNYRIDYNSISQTVEKVVKKIFLVRRNNSTSSGRQSSAIVGSTST